MQSPIQSQPLPDRALIGERCADHGKDTGREFRTKLADDLASLCSQVDALRRDPTKNAAQVELSVGEAVQTRVERLLAECEEHGRVTETFAATVERGIENAFQPMRPEWYALGAEYRAAMLRMAEDERADFVERVSKTRDEPLLRFAIASVPRELSGASVEAHKRMWDDTLALKNPELLTRPVDLQKRRASLAVAVDGIRRTARELYDADRVAALRALVGAGDKQ